MSEWLWRMPGMAAWRRMQDRRLCEATRARIQEIVDEELPPSVALDELLRHLRACERCGLEAEMIRELKALIRRIGLASGDDLAHRMEDRAHGLLAGGPHEPAS